MFLRYRYLIGFRSFSCNHGRVAMGALEGSSNTNLREISLRHGKPGPPPIHVIVTLDPKKFAEKKQKRLDIGDIKSFSPHISLHTQSSPVKAQRLEYEPTDRVYFGPLGMKAFLYYSTSPGKLRITGDLRLRVASSDDPPSFESGSDLLLSNGRPWSRPLYSLSKFYPVLYEKLREDGLVPDDLHTALSTLPLKTPSYCRSNVLNSLNDTFIVDFSISEMYLCVITEQGVEGLSLRLFSDYRQMRIVTPYTGSALVRFERSTLPVHEGTRTVVLRFLKIITPVKCVISNYDGYIPCPEEGELLQKSRRSLKVDWKLWSVNIDDKPKGRMIRGLRLLWDT